MCFALFDYFDLGGATMDSWTTWLATALAAASAVASALAVRAVERQTRASLEISQKDQLAQRVDSVVQQILRLSGLVADFRTAIHPYWKRIDPRAFVEKTAEERAQSEEARLLHEDWLGLLAAEVSVHQSVERYRVEILGLETTLSRLEKDIPGVLRDSVLLNARILHDALMCLYYVLLTDDLTTPQAVRSEFSAKALESGLGSSEISTICQQMTLDSDAGNAADSLVGAIMPRLVNATKDLVGAARV